jgi:hypothetical protein
MVGNVSMNQLVNKIGLSLSLSAHVKKDMALELIF